MKKLLHYARKQDTHVREKIAVALASITTALIVVIWVMTLSGRFERARSDTPESAKPFQLLGQVISSGVSDFRSETGMYAEILPLPEISQMNQAQLVGEDFIDIPVINETSVDSSRARELQSASEKLLEEKQIQISDQSAQIESETGY